MFILITTILVGISFAPFVLFKLDIWHAQGFWVQTGLMLAFSVSFFETPLRKDIPNKGLGWIHLWAGILTAYICFDAQSKGQYNTTAFFPYFNLLCMLFLYKFTVQYFTRSQVLKTLWWMKMVIIVTLWTCVLQFLHEKFGISSQFFVLATKHHAHNNLVSGYIGNGTHLSGFLASCFPLFLIRIDWKSLFYLVLMLGVMCVSGTQIGDPAVSGFIILVAVLGFYILMTDWKLFLVLLFVSLILLAVFIATTEHSFIKQLLNDNGRLELWKYYWEIFKKSRPVTGLGLGKINSVYGKTPFPAARHLHLEYFQCLFELGILGLTTVIYAIWQFFKKIPKDNTRLCLMCCVLGFLLSCCFNYPAHLWLPSTWVVFFYAAYNALDTKWS